MFYNADHFRGWQLVEEDIYEDWSSGNPGAVDERRAHIRGFWGARYIDDLVQTLVDGNADGDYVDTSGDDESFFFLSDAQFSVTAVLDGNANLQERVVYDAYGEANHHDWRDTDGDGDYDATDRSTINTLASASPSGTPITNASYEPDADLDRDGDVDSTDLSLGGTTYPTPLNKGELSLPAVGNRFGYDGYRFNPETEQYTVRHRHYDPILGRWLERDPAGYVDGFNLFGYAASSPAAFGDPTGQVAQRATWGAIGKIGTKVLGPIGAFQTTLSLLQFPDSLFSDDAQTVPLDSAIVKDFNTALHKYDNTFYDNRMAQQMRPPYGTRQPGWHWDWYAKIEIKEQDSLWMIDWALPDDQIATYWQHITGFSDERRVTELQGYFAFEFWCRESGWELILPNGDKVSFTTGDGNAEIVMSYDLALVVHFDSPPTYRTPYGWRDYLDSDTFYLGSGGSVPSTPVANLECSCE